MRDRIVSGEAIRRFRIELEMTQKDFAERCRLALSFIKYVEAGQSQPSDVNARRMARVLRRPVEDFSEPKATATSSGSAA